MFKLSCKIPRKVNLAFSGGVDSLVAAHFLKRGKHDVTLLHFNHGCEYSNEIERRCREEAAKLNLPIIVGIISGEQSKGQSLEDLWRRARYRFLRSFDDKFITVHTLDDSVETWIWSSCHGEGKIIPLSDDKVIRPFLLTKKDSIIEYAAKNELTPVDDPFNRDLHLTRNYMRANMMTHVYRINPGIDKVIRKKYLKLME